MRLEELHGQQITAVAASKFHSAALTACGRLYTWGFGRGGRLGKASFQQLPVWRPRQPCHGLLRLSTMQKVHKRIVYALLS